MTPQEIVKRFRLARDDEERVRLAWQLVRELARYSREEPFWDSIREMFGLRAETVKEIMFFLEERGKLDIKRSVDGKRLWISTLKDIKENPVRLDRWLGLISRKQPTR